MTADLQPEVSRPSEPAHFFDLEAVRAAAWSILALGVSDYRAAANRPTLATIGAGAIPQARTVVLRAFDLERRLLRFNTDTRAAKVAELAANPRAGVHVYDPSRNVQIRMHCLAEVLREGEAREAAWERTGGLSRHYYQVLETPGTPITDPGLAHFSGAESRGGFDHFAIIHATIESFEWLYLSDRGHRRARFEWQGSQWSGSWLAP